MKSKNFNLGSIWHRWEPHIHAPGTLKNDQFGDAADIWERYLTLLEQQTPVIKAIGLTDYYTTATYERLVQEKNNGRLPNCDLIFPNIELRLLVGTVKHKWANVHLLVNPTDENHLDELSRFLRELKFPANRDTYVCSHEDLIRLGAKTNPALTDERGKLKCGVEQFAVPLENLRDAYEKSGWARQNILVAVAGSETDGSSGIRAPADATVRKEVEAFAHVIFAASVAQREFWLGRRSGSLTEAQIRERYGSLKPCLHGSDAHSLEKVGKPDEDRRCWLKGAPCFDSLMQACYAPADRCYVGAEPPPMAPPSKTIADARISNAPWAKTPYVELNPGLVAIIGPRGSGKTALADIIAHGCYSTEEDDEEERKYSSFLKRARPKLGGARVGITWASGATTERCIDEPPLVFEEYESRARYLSQKFVEELCSADGPTDKLMREMHRVIFEAHEPEEVDGASDFDDLLEMKTSRFQDARQREENSLEEISDRIGEEVDKQRMLPTLQKQRADKAKQIDAYRADLAKLVSKGSEERVAQLTKLNVAAEKVRSYVRYYARQNESLLSIQDEVASRRSTGAPEELRRFKDRHAAAGLKGEAWDPFLTIYSGDVDGSLQAHLTSNAKETAYWKGKMVAAANATTSLIKDSEKLEEVPLSRIEAEIARIQKLVNFDTETQRAYDLRRRKLAEETALLARLDEKIKDCEGAKERREELQRERDASYTRLFEAISSEEQVLGQLYQPLLAKLKSSGGSLSKLTFSVRRVVDVEEWAKAGEDLLDLRVTGFFKGKGSLRSRAEAALCPAWKSGLPSEVSAAMASFRAENDEELTNSKAVPKTLQDDHRSWLRRYAKWLYRTSHIKLQYSIDYDGTDISNLSPGTRGIVLLLLYLALDTKDDSPLIIDQPEENLDPKSIFDELVQLFVDAKGKRQVIMVTHNANLVVNADADQVIIASAGTHKPGELPPITYIAGGMEEARIRKAVCDILEGGEDAFKERARRLRVNLDR